MAKFTFRKYQVSGALASFAQGGDIKLKGKVCGCYQKVRRGCEVAWCVWLQVETPGDGWRNVRLNAEFGSEESLRKWLQLRTDSLVGRYPLHFSE